MKLASGKYEFWFLMRTGVVPPPSLWANKEGNGYILVTLTRRNRRSHEWGGKSVQEAEHRIVMEEWLCRPLESREYVTHLNGDRSDNRLSNLKIITPREHAQACADAKKNRKNLVLEGKHDKS